MILLIAVMMRDAYSVGRGLWLCRACSCYCAVDNGVQVQNAEYVVQGFATRVCRVAASMSLAASLAVRQLVFQSIIAI